MHNKIKQLGKASGRGNEAAKKFVDPKKHVFRGFGPLDDA